MFNVLDSALFSLLNGYVRNSFLDSVLPFFSLSWPLWLGVAIFFSFFIVYCRKHYGDALWRLLVLGIMLGISVGVSETGASLMKDGFERSRPYEALSGTMHYDTQKNVWGQIQIPLNSMQDDDLIVVESMDVPNSPQENASLLNDTTNNASGDADNNSAGIGMSSADAGSATASMSVTDDTVSVADTIATTDITSDSATIDEVNLPDGTFSNTESEISNVNGTLGEQDVLLAYEVVTYSQTELQSMSDKQGYSMPSAFAANTMAMALVIALLFHKTNPWIYFMPILVGWSRVYTGNNYPMDILVGWIWGIMAVAVAWLICDVIFRLVSKNRKL